MGVSADAVWRSIAVTLRGSVLAAVDDPWARAQVLQLAALAELVREHGDDAGSGGTARARRLDELAVALDALAMNPLVRDRWPGDALVAASGALADAVGRDDVDANAVRATLRPVLVRHLDEDLANGAPLMDAFRGRLPR